MRLYVTFLIFLSLFNYSVASIEYNFEGLVNPDGSLDETLEWRIYPPSDSYYDEQNWELYAPLDATAFNFTTARPLQITDDNSIGAKILTFHFQEIHLSGQIVRIKYNIQNAIKQSGSNWIIERTFFPGIEASVRTNYFLRIPVKYKVIESIPIEMEKTNYSVIADTYDINETRLKYKFTDSESITLKIYGVTDSNTNNAPTENSNLSHTLINYNLTSDQNSTIVRTIMNEADNIFPKLEVHSGRKSLFGKLDVNFTPILPELHHTNSIAQYTGNGQINLFNEDRKYSHDDILQTLLHETVHALYDDNSGNNLPSWYAEGTAEQISKEVLEEHGIIFASDEKILIDCAKPTYVENYSSRLVDFNYSTITYWSPNLGDKKLTCDNSVEIYLDQLMYLFSSKIIKDIENEFGRGILSEIEQKRVDENVVYSTIPEQFNNQINLFVSKSTMKNSTSFFIKHYLAVDEWDVLDAKHQNANAAIEELSKKSNGAFFQSSNSIIQNARIKFFSGDFKGATQLIELGLFEANDIEKDRQNTISRINLIENEVSRRQNKNAFVEVLNAISSARSAYSSGNLGLMSDLASIANDKLNETDQKILKISIILSQAEVQKQQHENFLDKFIYGAAIEDLKKSKESLQKGDLDESESFASNSLKLFELDLLSAIFKNIWPNF